MNQIKIPDWKRAVIKVGSSLVAPDGKASSTKYTLAIANFIIQNHNLGREIILVSSGAVAAGLATQQNFKAKSNRSIPEKQALAAIGQPLLMQSWSRFFDFPCAQVLLTMDGLHNRERYVNAKNTINELLKLKTLPIVNENDTVAVEELKVGDNDNLAAHVAVLAEADLLIICTDIDGLYDDNPTKNKNAKLIPVVEIINDKIYSLAGGSNNPIATGGMRTKIEAAEKAVSGGINTIIMNGTKSKSFDSIMDGKVHGTLIKKLKTPVAAKKHWLMHTMINEGKVIIDEGAKNAIINKGASLLSTGIIAIEGTFTVGAAISVVFIDGKNEMIIAKGTTQYNSQDLSKIKGKKSGEIESILGYLTNKEVIDRSDMVLINNTNGVKNDK
ncbi:MAG: glutamate 5-kinase [Bacteroidetes bacterium]|nr:glutamate 5-kinase [Bacteroidota bacterium]MBU1116497.1 glutamate 5-kinase [Bacteroidota bacterium]MBU1797151.1 glutamate 5-kinase [Bacteroidota bacterium]